MTAPDTAHDAAAFAAYHRGGIPRRVGAVLASVLGAGAVVAGIVAVGFAAPSAAAAPQRVTADIPVASPSASAAVTTIAAIEAPSAVSTPSASAAPASPALAATGPAQYAIDITATGYQAELDRCQWVRMDLVPDEPIVGAHTSCGGVIVLRMNAGDEVTLTGQGLDGRYIVGAARDAHAGDVASTALAALGPASPGAVVLQTCYPGTSGRERLVALTPTS